MCLSLAFFAISLKKSSTMLNDSNVEALSEDSGDPQITYRYPNREGKAVFCTLYIAINMETQARVVLGEEASEAEVEAGWVKTSVKGLKDRCPTPSNLGCNPYSCQEIPY
jgi:hypothetical protein